MCTEYLIHRLSFHPNPTFSLAFLRYTPFRIITFLFLFQLNMVARKGADLCRYNCRGRMDDVGFAMLRDWTKRKEGNLTQRAKWLAVSRHCISLNMSQDVKPSQRHSHKPPLLSSDRLKDIDKRRQLVHKLATEKRLHVGMKLSKVFRKPQFKKVILKTYPSVAKVRRELGRGHQIEVSNRTIRRDLAKVGLINKKRGKGPWFKPEHIEARLAISRDFVMKSDDQQEEFLKNVYFSDEKWANCQGGRIKTEWCEKDQEPSVIEYEQYPETVRVWGMIGVGFKHMVILPSDETITAAVYQEYAITPVLRRLQKKGAIFMQDGAGCHHGTEKWLTEKKVNWMKWPARSCDLNPIENLWSMIDRKVAAYGPWGREEVEKFWRKEWDAIPQSQIDTLVRSYRRRVGDCIERKGAVVRV
jgi:hypothetical protein